MLEDEQVSKDFGDAAYEVLGVAISAVCAIEVTLRREMMVVPEHSVLFEGGEGGYGYGERGIVGGEACKLVVVGGSAEEV